MATGRASRFVVNVVWSWVGVAVNLTAGFVLTRYLIQKLGDEGYGLWALLFALVDYYYLFDLGFRSATVKFVAHYRALDDDDKLGEVVSTSLAYAMGIAIALYLVTLGLAPFAGHLLKVSPEHRAQLPTLVRLVALTWCLGMVFNLLGACLEASQNFGLSTRAWIAGATTRTVGTAILLWRGYGLVELVIMALASQTICFVFYWRYFRQVFPKTEISFRRATRRMLRELSGFGIHAFLANISQQFLSQTTPALIAWFQPTAFVGYYNLPVRLLQTTIEAVARIGLVTNTNTAELAAKKDSRMLTELAVYSNRYCLMLYFPLAIVLFTHGGELLARWVGPEFASHSAPVLPILLGGSMIALVGQFNSSMLLFGLAKHHGYARSMMVEAVIGVGALVAVLPRYGIVGAAWVVAVSMTLNRGLFTPWLVCREFGLGFAKFMSDIYLRPTLTAIPVFALCWWLKSAGLPGKTWLELIEVGAISAVTYYGMAYFTSIPREHRTLMTARLKGLLQGLAQRFA